MILPYDTGFAPPVATHPTREAITTQPTMTVRLRENPALVPEAVATGVLEEASTKRGKPRPREWAEYFQR